ncbi:GIN domain-containing protein [Myroides odoratimimus]|uniref:GIN domain-containing protein n=1 Tax=Myroides odoratimimus TaxID=76832 RepID=UPI0031010A60
MKKIVMFFLLVGGSVFAQSKETRQVSDFKSVKASQGIEVNFTYGGTKSVVVEVEKSENMKDVKTETTITGGLDIFIDQKSNKKWKNGINIRDFGKVVVTINNPSLEEVRLSSSAKFNLLNKAVAKSFYVKTCSSARFRGELVQADNLSIEASSSSKIEGSFEVTKKSSASVSSSASVDISLKTKTGDFGASSSARLSLSGNADSVNASASSSGSIKGSSFTTKTLEGKASSSGSMVFNVTEEVSGRASSSGRVQYTGGAKIVSSNTSSSGQVKNID